MPVKKSATEIHHLHIDGDEVTELADISNKIGQTFSDNSSAENYNSNSNHSETRLKVNNSNLITQNLITISFPCKNFSSSVTYPAMGMGPLLLELTDAMSKSHDTAVGLDDIHYQMLKHLPMKL